MKVKLVRGWRSWWRQWSTWLTSIGIAIVSFTPELSEVLTHVWINTPIDIKGAFTQEHVKYFGIALTAISIPARFIRQRKLYESEFGESTENDSGRGGEKKQAV